MSDASDLGVLSCDDFLGGSLRIWQPNKGYRAGVDPVLLAASVAAKPGETLLDLGCGAGVAGLCAARRVTGLNVTGLERHSGYAALADKNANENALPFEVVTGDLTDPPEQIKSRRFHHVIANPPYFDRTRSAPSPDDAREVALGEQTHISVWVAQSAKRVLPKGYVTFIQQAERLPELMTAFQTHLGSLELLPLLPRSGRPARLVLLRGRKGGRSAFRLHPGWMLHQGQSHLTDAEDYTDQTRAVLRDSAALSF